MSDEQPAPLYADRDHLAQGNYYTRHVMAMTAEDLHRKSAIAGELAHRDMEIERLRKAAERERLAADIKVLSLAARAVSTALDELVGACMDDFMDPKVPSRRALMHARSMLPPTCEHALKKAPAGEKT